MKVKTKSNLFQKGHRRFGEGRPKGVRNYFSVLQLEQAVKAVEDKKKQSLYEYFVERAFKNDKVLIALMKKIVPDLSREEGDPGEAFNEDLQILTTEQEGQIENRIGDYLN